MVRHGLVDEVTGYVDDVNAFMMNLEKIKVISSQCQRP